MKWPLTWYLFIKVRGHFSFMGRLMGQRLVHAPEMWLANPSTADRCIVGVT